MFTYALLVSPEGLPEPLRGHLEGIHRDRLFDDELTFPVHERLLWFDPTGTAAVIGWWSGLDELGGGRPWAEVGGGLTAYTGSLWPRGTGWRRVGDWAEQLQPVLAGADVRGDDHGLSGVFSAVHVDADGSGLLVSDPLGFSLVYRATGDGVTVYGNRSPVCARLHAGPQEAPRRSAEGAGWMAFAGDYLDDVTAFEAVQVVPIGTRVEWSPRRVVEVTAAHPATWFDRGMGVDEAVALVTDELVAEVEVIAALPVSRRVAELTGGKDSRLILSGLLRAGRTDDFSFHTSGAPTTPDVVVADRLVDRYQLARGGPRRVGQLPGDGWAPIGADDPGGHVELMHLHYGFLAAGGGNGWNGRSVSIPYQGVTVNGLAGELLRTGYAGTSHLTTFDHIHRFLSHGLKIGIGGFVRDDRIGHYQDRLRLIVDECQQGAATPQDAVDRYYLRARLRRWVGTNHEFHRSVRVFPLLNARMWAAAFAVGQSARRSELLFYRVMQAVDPGLVTEPFGETKWPHQLGGFMPDIDPDLLGEPPPPPLPPRPLAPSKPAIGRSKKKAKQTVARANRAERAEEEARLRHRYLVEAPDNEIFDVVDRARVLDGIDNYDDLPGQARYQLTGALTAAIWLGGHERRVVAGP